MKRTCFSLLLLLAGCGEVNLTPRKPDYRYGEPCLARPHFELIANRASRFGGYGAQSAFVSINGERIRLQPPSSGPWGSYQYSGLIPHDGEIRFRYFFNYTYGGVRRTKFVPDQYWHRTVGDISWTSRQVFTTPDADQREMPHRIMLLTDTIPPNYSGRLTMTRQLTIRNGNTVGISLRNFRLIDRQSGNPATDMAITVGGAPIGQTLAIGPGAVATFDVAYSAIAAGLPEESLSRRAALSFDWSADGGMVPQNCRFGPIWIDGLFFHNPG